MTAVPASRIHYLDVFRSFAMLLGVLVHTATLGEFGILEYPAMFSDYFRMAGFFLVSGFFAAMLISRRSLRAFWTARLQAVLVPLVAGLVLLNPLTLVLVVEHHNTGIVAQRGIIGALQDSVVKPSGIAGPSVWHLHLWFLFSLAFFVLVAPAVDRFSRSAHFRRLAAVSLTRAPSFLTTLLLASAISLGVLAMRLVDKVLVDPIADIWLLQATLGYLPFFAAGVIFFAHRDLWEAAHRVDAPTFIAGGALFAGAHIGSALALPPIGVAALEILATAMLRCAMIFSLFCLFRRFFDFKTAATQFLSSSIYTVYIFHFILIYVAALLLENLQPGSPGLFFAVCGLTTVTGFALHRWVIEPIAAFRFLFNGRPLRPGDRSSSGAPA